MIDERSPEKEETQHVAAMEELAEWRLVHTYRRELHQL